MDAYSKQHAYVVSMAGRKVSKLLFFTFLIWAFGVSTVFAVQNLDASQMHFRGRNNALRVDSSSVEDMVLEVGDVVSFGVVPAGLTDTKLEAGERLQWIVVALEEKADASAQHELIATLILDPSQSLGIRRINRLETLVPRSDAYDKWAGSELAAWLNSSKKGPNGIDYSLTSGGVSGYGFLETAFSNDVINYVIEGYDSTDDLQVVVPTLEELVDWDLDVNAKTISRNPGSGLYGLKAGKNPEDSKEIAATGKGIVLPVIRVNLFEVSDESRDYHEEILDEFDPELPTIYSQPQSVSFSVEALQGMAPTQALAEVGAALASVDLDEQEQYYEDYLTYQWYQRTVGQPEGVPVDTEAGAALLLEATGIEGAGRYVFFCEVIHEVEGKTSVVRTVDIVVSVGEIQSATLTCSDCHSSNTRKWHTAFKDEDGGYCGTCHTQTSKDWSETRYPEDGFEGYKIGCGLGEARCHVEWHGEDVFAKHEVSHEVVVGDPLTGEAVTKEYAQLRAKQKDAAPLVTNSCGGSVYGSACHAVGSQQSAFYFGSMNLLTAHNDYAKALTDIDESTDEDIYPEALGSSGCMACHEPDGGAPLAKEREAGEKISCNTCHKAENGTYKAGNATLPCYVAVPQKQQAADAPRRVTGQSVETTTTATQVSGLVRELTDDLLGVTPIAKPLEAGVSTPAPLELPKTSFPVGTLLDGTSPFLNP